MPDKADELRLAAFAEKLWRLELGIENGPDRVFDPEGLTVDFVYPSSSPRPLALEITTLAYSYLPVGEYTRAGTTTEVADLLDLGYRADDP